jgi:hypothetical protein
MLIMHIYSQIEFIVCICLEYWNCKRQKVNATKIIETIQSMFYFTAMTIVLLLVCGRDQGRGRRGWLVRTIDGG